jgi:hypothetical protein
MRKSLFRILEFSRITRLFRINEDQDVKGAVCPNFERLLLLFPLSPSICKVQPCIVPLSSEYALRLLAVRPIFLLDPVFYFPYILSIKKRLLINW